MIALIVKKFMYIVINISIICSKEYNYFQLYFSAFTFILSPKDLIKFKFKNLSIKR